MFRETGCDAVMIGRAAAVNPWIFRQMVDYFATGRYAEPTDADRYQLLREFCRRLQAADDPEALGKMKQFASRFTRGLRGGATLRQAVHAARSTAEVIERVEAFFSRPSGLPHSAETASEDTVPAVWAAAD